MTIDEEYLETLARERQQKAAGNYDHCRACWHEWHGLTCPKPVAADHRVVTPCNCPGSAA